MILLMPHTFIQILPLRILRVDKFFRQYANNSSKYEWLIKLHPVDYEANYDKMVDIIKRYKNLKLLDQKINHLTLLSEKVKCVLTVYGSISHEYPLFNIPVINAGNNPHKGYNFHTML